MKDKIIKYYPYSVKKAYFCMPVKMDTTNSHILDSIRIPKDLRKLEIKELPQVCNELRQLIIDELAKIRGTWEPALE